MASETLNMEIVEEVWMIPCGTRPDKPSLLAAEDRFEMCQRAVNDFFPKDFPVKVDDIEIQNGTQIKTYDLLQKLKQVHGPKYDFNFMIGSDLVPKLHLYHEKMISDVNFIIFNRAGYEHIFDSSPKDYPMPHTYKLIDCDRNLLGMISSTEVRKRISETRLAHKNKKFTAANLFLKIGGLVSKTTIEYINEKNIYLDDWANLKYEIN